MTCDEADILLHALIDGELDAGHARDVEGHIASCPRCAAALADYRKMSEMIAGADVRYTAPPGLRQRIESEVVSAHLRSLQAGHLIDVVSTDQHTVKPWFNGKLDVSPPVVDLTAQGFTLVGGRLDYLDARAIGAVVYRRRQHIINLFVAQTANTERKAASMENLQGFNVRRWSQQGMNFWAVSDIGPDELNEFGAKFEAALASSS